MKEKLMQLQLSVYGMDQLSFLIQNDEDYNVFVTDYWLKSPREIKAIADFRKDKQQKNEMSLSQFKEEYKENKIKALEKLFQHRVLQQDVDKLAEILDKRRGELGDVYTYAIQDRKKSLLTWLSTTILKK